MHCKVIPSYVKSFKKQYICLLSINQEFGYLIKNLEYDDVKKESLKKRSVFIDKIYNYIKRYGEAVKSGFFKDLSNEELPTDIFYYIEYIDMVIEEILEKYLEPCTEEDDEYEYDDCIFKLNKQKYENNVDKDFPGLRKLIDTLSFYYKKIKYIKNYIYPLNKTSNCFNISYSDSDSDSDSESERELSNEDIQDILKYIENEDEEIIAYNYDTDTDNDNDSD